MLQSIESTWDDVLEDVLAEVRALHIVHTCRSASLYEDEQIWTQIPAAYRVLDMETASSVLQAQGAALAEALLMPFQRPPQQFLRPERDDPGDPDSPSVYRYLPAKKAVQVRALASRIQDLLGKIVGCSESKYVQILEPGCGRGLVSQTMGISLEQSGFKPRIEFIGIDKDERFCRSFRERWKRLGPMKEGIRHIVQHSFIACAADLERCAGREPNECKSNDVQYVVLALHGCGDLSASVLQTLDHELCSLRPIALFCIGCCYHKLLKQRIDGARLCCSNKNASFPLSQWLLNRPEFSFGAQAHGGSALLNRSSLYLASADATALRRPDSRRAQRIIQHHHYRAILQILLRRMTEEHRNSADAVRTLLETEGDPRWALLRRTAKHIDQYQDFAAYAEDALRYLQLPVDRVLVKDVASLFDTPVYRHRCLVFWSLCGRLAPMLEALVLLDRFWYARECGYVAWIEEMFPASASPRNQAIVAIREDVVNQAACTQPAVNASIGEGVLSGGSREERSGANDALASEKAARPVMQSRS
ncbi:hypothetical protein CCYA_CCYA14G3717 [Cyanidiococcus yangmingshanensis]|nr:hypothetical protein CCYA_CCYA14G3717 [Cyanidiococcus yangmingshanensis]